MLVKKCPLGDDFKAKIIEDESDEMVQQVFDSQQDKVILDLIRKDYAQGEG